MHVDVFCFSILLLWVYTVKSLCDDCVNYPEPCPFIASPLLRGATAVRMQLLVTSSAVLTSRLSLY